MFAALALRYRAARLRFTREQALLQWETLCYRVRHFFLWLGTEPLTDDEWNDIRENCPNLANAYHRQVMTETEVANSYREGKAFNELRARQSR